MKSLAQLTQDDVAVLRSEKRIGSVFAVFVICLGLLLSLIYTLVEKSGDVMFWSGVIALSSILLSVLVYYMVNYRLIMDIKSNQKVLILDMVQEKQKVASSEAGSGAMFIPILGNLFPKLWGQQMKTANKYFFIIKNIRYEVDEKVYNNVNVGDIVQRHCAKLSRTIFRFELVL
jgi:hypothetical protein